ncbi:helix-turn-helix domain-containing protein [Burkholderia ubonensis]|uniref:helix-turn-helix domain-containing protein n=1 Tax=Burkholderia ubonensis TaxID=101571 RepID=UPI0009B41593|nr:helix-turn-helix domain-containing protein [Burkholderia ubonensis]
MSFQAMTWAVEQDLPALQKLVLLMLANCCNSHTGRCDPSHDTLAKECGMSRDSVRRAIAEIEKKGLIEIRRQTQNGVNLPNQYVLKVGSSGGVVGAVSTEGYVHTAPTVGADSTGGRCSQQGGVGADSTTNQEVKPGSKPNTSSEESGRSVSRAKKSAERKTPLPENFAISDRIRQWASDKGYARLQDRFDHFVGTSKAKGYRYVDWDQAFMNAIRDDWAKLGNDAAQKYQPALVW